LIDLLSKFSCWSKAIRAVARLLRRANKDKSNHLSLNGKRQNFIYSYCKWVLRRM